MDADLVRRAREGDHTAWSALIQQHQEALFRLAYLLLGDADEAEDVTQETFIRAFRMLHRFDTNRPLRPWLLRIASNLAHNQRRGASRHLAALNRFYQSKLVESSGPEYEQEVEARALWQAVRRLDTKDQHVIYLRYFLDLPVPEVAETLDIPPGTVKSRLNCALERLRKVIERDFPLLWEERVP